MPIFHRKAIEAAVYPAAVDWLRPEHLADLVGLAKALDRLTPEQRCDAIYADWLLRLNEDRALILPIRNYLIGQGALAANYLAELAQNADDAADGKAAEIRIAPDEDWLFVANNGRKVTSLNLLGLSRFFVHAAGQMVELNEQTIGRFGIGFKSCYRIASEVVVFSRNDAQEEFGFRLPICREGDAASTPNAERLDSLMRRLSEVGAGNLDDEVRQVRCLGYCTPEFLSALPAELSERTTPFQQTGQGTLFCFRIRPERLEEVKRRVSGQLREVYELCPLFLPNVRFVQLGSNSLKMRIGQRDQAKDLANLVEADRITLTTSTPNQRDSHSRFWRLREPGEEPIWQVALHADGKHQLRLDKEDDEQGMTLKDGAAYSFFPLNAVSWPFRFHLHIKLPTDLARKDWNPDDRQQVEEQLRRAVSGLCNWLEKKTELWHPQWRLPLLVVRKPNPGETWAWLAWQQLQKEVRTKRLLRTVWGNAASAQDARTVRLIARDAAQANWSQFCGLLAGMEADFPLVDTTDTVDFGLTELPDNLLRAFFLKVAVQITDDAGRHALVMALFSVESAEPETLERVAVQIEVPCSDGTSQPLSKLMKRPGGSDLPDEWHAVFKTLRNWLQDLSHGLTAVFDKTLLYQLKKLSERVFNPHWEAVPVALGNDDAWINHGKAFWDADREPCPAGCRKVVIQTLQVKDGTGQWKPISAVWLDGNLSVECFRGVVSKWEPGIVGHHTAQRRIQDKLKEWQLWDEWENAVESRLREGLAKRLNETLSQEAETQPGRIYLQQPLEVVFQGVHANSREQLATRWKAVVREAEQEATRKFVRARQGDLTAAQMLASDLEKELASFLAATGMFKAAPRWLTSFAIGCVRAAGEGELLESLTLVKNSDLTEQGRRALVVQLLEGFNHWKDKPFTEQQLQAFQKLCETTPATERKNWKVSITTRTSFLVRDLLNPELMPDALTDSNQTNQTQPDDGTLNRELLMEKGIRWHQAEHLPDLLRRVPAVASASLSASRLKVEVIPGSTPLPTREEDLLADTANNPRFRSLLQQCAGRLARCASPLVVRWLNGEALVAELRDAPFAVIDGQLVTTQVQRVLDDKQFTEILSLYARSARNGQAFDEFQHDWQADVVSHAQLYAKHRKSVVHTLLKTLVTDPGYREHHVVRELLQNAESAYDSKPGEPAPTCEFEFVLHPPTTGNAWEAVASHSGRHFNEALWNRRQNTTEQRNDIHLIVSTPSSEAPPTEGWVGRFNRGFKSLFTVTEKVEVISGPYRFAIHDMLRLDPNPPQPDAGPTSTQTKFSFRCTTTDALKLLQLESVDRQQRGLPVFDPSSFIFLQRVNHVRIQADHWVWEWKITRTQHSTGWTLVDVEQSFPQQKERFLVHRSEIAGTPERRFSVAIRLDADLQAIRPAKLDDGWHKIRLTFPTDDEPFPLDILVNGDFETDSGRLGIASSAANETLLAACLKAARELCESEVGASAEPQCWLAWADILHLAKGEDELAQRFDQHTALVREHSSLAEFLITHIVCDGRWQSPKDFVFPTELLRRLAAFVRCWGFDTSGWIDPEFRKRLPDRVVRAQPKMGIDDVVTGVTAQNLRNRIAADFCRTDFLDKVGNLGADDAPEFERAKRFIEPIVVKPTEVKSVADLWNWWINNGKPIEQYTLDGANWTMLFPGDQTPEEQRAARLCSRLRQPETKEGKLAWYRILGLACLMSGAGHGRIESLRRFWTEELERPDRNFWNATAGHEFSEATKTLFGELALRLANPNAQGEWADYWRHVFYDVRKVHELVWNQQFADTVLGLLMDPERAMLLPQFLRDGQLPGQQPWAGVLGQSAGAPLFFLTRELCRLGIANSAELRPLAFFVCTPVRRAAERIGWLEPGDSDRTDFRSMARMSEKLYRRIADDTEVAGEIREQMLDLYDIPLLHYGLNG